MPRIPYVPADLPGPIADAIRTRRGDRGLTPLDRSLLQSPSIAEGWSKLLGAVRTGSSLQDDLREIMVRLKGGVVYSGAMFVLIMSLSPSCSLRFAGWLPGIKLALSGFITSI
jgi:hypothetical protein